jgi:hypothetical protein
MLELDKYQKDTFTFELKLPVPSKEKVMVTVRSDSHPTVVEVSKNLQLEGQQHEASSRKRGKKPDDPMTEEEYEYYRNAGVRRIVSYVEKIENLSLDGKEIKDDPALIAKALSKYDWITEQVMEEAKSIVNFCS